MLATLAASPDGRPEPHEQKTVERHLAPVIKRLGPDGQRIAMDLLREMVRGEGTDSTLGAIRAALPNARDRIEAMRFAALVAFTDAKVAAGEDEHIKALAAAMGVTEQDFASVLPRRSRPVAMVDTPRLTHEEAVLMLAVLSGSADGVPQDEEALVMTERLAATLGTLGPSGRARTLARLTDLIDEEGFDGALLAIRESLPEPEVRHSALRLAASVVFADGLITHHEREHMTRVATALRLSKEELATVLPTR